MDLEGDILRSFPDDSGDTLVAPELAQWAIGHLQVEAEETNRLVDSLLWVEENISDDNISSRGTTPRVDSMDPEKDFEGPALAKSPTTKSSKSGKGGGGSSRRAKGWWKSDVDYEGEMEELSSQESATDRGDGQMYPIQLCRRRRSRVLRALRRSFSMQ
jgi:hypothetical protein